MGVQVGDGVVEGGGEAVDHGVGEGVDEGEERVAEEPEEQGPDNDHGQIHQGRSKVLAYLSGEESVNDAEQVEHDKQRGGETEYRLLDR